MIPQRRNVRRVAERVEPQKSRRITRQSSRVDHISQLPDCILLYIMGMAFVSTKEAVQTCVLSKRWQNLWKCFPMLVVDNYEFPKANLFKTFLSKVLTHRDRSSILHTIDVGHDGVIPFEILRRLFKYGISHEVENLTIKADTSCYVPKLLEITSSMLSGHSLKYLSLTLYRIGGKSILPHTLNLPQLEVCYLRDLTFSSNDDDNGNFVEPFSGCKKLETLVLDCCDLLDRDKDKNKTLCVVNDSVTRLTIRFGIEMYDPCKVQIQAPNVKYFTFAGKLTTRNGTHKLIQRDLNFLQEVNFEVWSDGHVYRKVAQTVNSCIKMFTNANLMAVSSATLKVP